MNTFNNICDAKFEEDLLSVAYRTHVESMGRSVRYELTVFMYGAYPCLRIGRRKIHIHRLIMAYLLDKPLNFKQYVHHINGDKRDARTINLELMDRAHHARMHNPKKKKRKQ